MRQRRSRDFSRDSAMFKFAAVVVSAVDLANMIPFGNEVHKTLRIAYPRSHFLVRIKFGFS